MDIGSLTGAVKIEDQLSSKMEMLSHRVSEFATHFDGAMGATAIAAGVVVTAITGVTASIIALGEKGSKILGVEQAFDRLALKAGTTGDALRAGLTEGVKGTVGQFELMERTSRLLSSGMKLTADQATLLGEASRELGKATGGDAASGLSTLSAALTTGRVRSLQQQIGIIDLKKAEDEFAKSLGTTRDKLSAAGKLEADRIGILQATKTWLDRIGTSELSFAEHIQRGRVALSEWGDSLAKAVASSPHVLNALTKIEEALQTTFGGTGKTLLETIVGWVDRFADAVAEYGPMIIKTMGNILTAIVDIWHTVQNAWDMVPDWFKNIAKDAGIASGAVLLVHEAVGAATGSDVLGSLANLAQIWSVIGDAAVRASRAIKEWMTLLVVFKWEAVSLALQSIGTALAGIAASSLGITALFVALGAAVWQVVKAFEGLYEAEDKWLYLTQQNKDNWVRRWLGLDTGVPKPTKITDTNLPKPIGMLEGPGIAGVQGFGEVAPNFLKASTAAEDFKKKVEELLKKLRGGASDEVAVFAAAFDKLTVAERGSYEMQVKLVPLIESYAAAHRGQATPAMMESYNAFVQENTAMMSAQKAMLAGANITQEYINGQKDLGKTETQIAMQLGVMPAALQAYLAELDKFEQHRKQQASIRQREVDRAAEAEQAGQKAIMEAREQLDDLIMKSTMTTTQYQIAQIDKWEKKQKDAFVGSADQAMVYAAVIHQIAARQKGAVLIDWDALRDNSKEALQDIATKAYMTWQAMEQDAGHFSPAVRKHFKEIYEEAQRTADGTLTAWQHTFKALSYAEQILGAIPGKFGEISSAAIQSAQAIGQAFAEGGPIAGIVTAVQEGIKWLGKLWKSMHDGRDEIKKFAESFDTAAPGTGFDELHRKLLKLGPAGEQMWISLTQGTPAGNATEAKRKIKEVQAALDALDSDIQKYKLSWTDLADAQSAGADAGKELVYSFQRLTGAGYKTDTVLTNMSGDLNQYVIDSIKAGTKIPPAMRPILEQLIKMGKLSNDAAKALMGMADDGMPKLADIKDAAERYGITLDSLGPRVKQLEINELAAQYVADWDVLSKSTDNWGAIMDGMRPKVQDLINDAIKYGSELPANMKPMIQAFIDAGQLTDENGQKLTDLSKLTFAADLTGMFETLIEKLDQFIGKLTGPNGVTGALDSIGGRTLQPIEIPYHFKNTGEELPQEERDRMIPLEQHATGGRVGRTKVIPFPTQGGDTVFGAFSPGEIVLNAAQTANVANSIASPEVIANAVASAIKSVGGTGGPPVIIPVVQGQSIDEIIDQVIARLPRDVKFNRNELRTALRAALGVAA